MPLVGGQVLRSRRMLRHVRAIATATSTAKMPRSPLSQPPTAPVIAASSNAGAATDDNHRGREQHRQQSALHVVAHPAYPCTAAG